MRLTMDERKSLTKFSEQDMCMQLILNEFISYTGFNRYYAARSLRKKELF